MFVILKNNKFLYLDNRCVVRVELSFFYKHYFDYLNLKRIYQYLNIHT